MSVYLKQSKYRRLPGRMREPSAAARKEGLISFYSTLGGNTISNLPDPTTAHLRDAASPRRTVQISNGIGGGQIMGLYGPMAYFPTGDTWYSSSNAPMDWKAAGLTMFIVYRPSVAVPTAAATLACLAHTSAASFFQMDHLNSSGNCRIAIRDNASTTGTAGTFTVVAGRTYVLAGWTDGVSNHGLRANGTSYTSSTTMSTVTAADRFAIGAKQQATGSGPCPIGSAIGPVLIYNNVLSAARIDQISSNPFQVLQPRRIFILSAAAAGPSGNPNYYYAQQ